MLSQPIANLAKNAITTVAKTTGAAIVGAAGAVASGMAAGSSSTAVFFGREVANSVSKEPTQNIIDAATIIPNSVMNAVHNNISILVAGMAIGISAATAITSLYGVTYMIEESKKNDIKKHNHDTNQNENKEDDITKLSDVEISSLNNQKNVSLKR